MSTEELKQTVIQASVQASIQTAKSEQVDIRPVLKEEGYRRAERPAFVSSMAIFFAAVTPIVFASFRMVAAAHGWNVNLHEEVLYQAYATGLSSILVKGIKDRLSTPKPPKAEP